MWYGTAIIQNDIKYKKSKYIAYAYVNRVFPLVKSSSLKEVSKNKSIS